MIRLSAGRREGASSAFLSAGSPQGLKPFSFVTLDGTTKVVPFPISFIYLFFIYLFFFVSSALSLRRRFLNKKFCVRSTLLHNLFQCCQQAIHFFDGVVVDEADAEEAAGFFYVEALGEVQGVVVSVPGEEAAVA